jgi:hypothetical protein
MKPGGKCGINSPGMTFDGCCRGGHARRGVVPRQQSEIISRSRERLGSGVNRRRSHSHPSISLLELTYLVEKGRLPAGARKRLVDALGESGGPYELVPLDGPWPPPSSALIARWLRICRTGDRGNGAACRRSLVSRDGKIRAAQIHTIW